MKSAYLTREADDRGTQFVAGIYYTTGIATLHFKTYDANRDAIRWA
jgi:hypothetical protein